MLQERACFNFWKEMNMKTAYRVAIAAALGLGLAAAASAHPGEMGGAMGPGAMGGQQLMTPEERTALMDKMRNAKTPEERQKIAEANRAEMEKRANEKGIALPGPHGPGMGFGSGFHLEKD
jgi:hypothetical protein